MKKIKREIIRNLHLIFCGISGILLSRITTYIDTLDLTQTLYRWSIVGLILVVFLVFVVATVLQEITRNFI